MSRNVSTPPITSPPLSLNKAVEIAIACRSPLASIMWTALLIIGLPVLIVSRSAQSVSQTSALRMSLHLKPSAFSREIPAIFSAALLNEVICQSESIVKTPSVIESRITSRSLLGSLVCIAHLYHTNMMFTRPKVRWQSFHTRCTSPNTCGHKDVNVSSSSSHSRSFLC
jgi:hypothetical protein